MTVFEITSVVRSVFGVVGAVVTLYLAVRVGATIYDVCWRWKHNDWSVPD